MSSFFVDTERLSERYEQGLRLKQPVQEDLKRLHMQISEICSSLKDRGRNRRAAELEDLMTEIEKTSGNILDVCGFDRCAAEEYNRLLVKIDDIVSAIEI